MGNIHGGDIYRNHVDADFSVNVNPLGIPKSVEKAMHEAVDSCMAYPDIEAEKLTEALSEMLDVPKEFFVFGNGASELFIAIVHAICPQKTVIPVPSFYGYEYAAKASGGKVIYQDGFEVLTEDVDLLFLANPNNPTGSLLSKEHLMELLDYCMERHIYVVLDECFIEFCGEEMSMIPEIKKYKNLMIVRAFTKIFAIPGVRLGYLVCSNEALRTKIQRQLPEWNLSCFAQAAGCACVQEKGFVETTAAFVKKERKFLEEGLKKLGMKVFPGEANFILLYSETDLYENLLKRGILIRDCSNYRGLESGYYRIAVKTREENERLLEAIGEVR